MKLIYFFSSCIIIFLLVSCRPTQKTVDNKLGSNDFYQYLNEIKNDTARFELPALQITDSSILQILDSVIFLTENCKYFDNRIKYQHAFMISSTILSNGLQRFCIDALRSIEDVIGVSLNRALSGLNLPNNVGVFYYKNYLFCKLLDTEYPFLTKNGSTYRIQATRLFNDRTYSSYINFIVEDNQYKIINNEMCGSIILIE